MSEAILAGIWLGISVNILIGPVFFTILDTTMELGKKAGFAVAVGIFCSDTMLASSSYFGLRNIAGNETLQTMIGLLGGIILIGFGSYLFLSQNVSKKHQKLSYSSYGRYWSRGFMINTFNPFTIIVWITLASVRVFTPDTPMIRIGFYSGMLSSIFIIDLGKIFISGTIRERLTDRGILTIRKISGSAIFIFGIVLLIRTFISNDLSMP